MPAAAPSLPGVPRPRCATHSPTRSATSVGCSPRWRHRANIVLAVRIASSKRCPATSARNRTWSASARIWSGPSSAGSTLHAAVLDATEGLPVERIQPGRPVGLAERAAAVLRATCSSRQLGERHRLVAGAFGDALLAEEEDPLLHEALQVILGGVARVQLAHFRQELILQRRLRAPASAGRRDGPRLPRRPESRAPRPVSRAIKERRRVMAEYSRRQVLRQSGRWPGSCDFAHFWRVIS